VGCCAGCKCQGIPRVTFWSTASPGVAVGDYYLRTQNQHARETENWTVPEGLTRYSSCRFSSQVDETTVVEWDADTRFLYVSTVDADGHVLARHEFHELIDQDESGNYRTELTHAVEIVQGANPDEYVLTFSGWCAALPLDISISSNLSPLDPDGVPPTLTQTSAHVWTFTRATDTGPNPLNVKTTLAIGLTSVDIYRLDTLETVETTIATENVTIDVLDGTGCDALRRELFHYVRTFGSNTDLDPAPLYIQLDMTEKRGEPIHRDTHNVVRAAVQIQFDESSGWFPPTDIQHQSLIAAARSSGATSARWDFPIAVADLPESDPAQNKQGVAVLLHLCNAGDWLIELVRGAGDIYDEFRPITPQVRGDRPGFMVFEWERRIIKTVPDADGSHPNDAAIVYRDLNPDWDLTGKRINVYVLAEIDATGGSHYFQHPRQSPSLPTSDPEAHPRRALDVESDGWSGPNAAYLNQTLSRFFDFGSVNWPHPEISLAAWQIGIRTPDAPVGFGAAFEFVQFTHSMSVVEHDPNQFNYHERRTELHVTEGAAGHRTIWEPSDGRLLVDHFYDDPIEWTLKEDVDAQGHDSGATITTKLSWTVPGACWDYEDLGHDSPLVFQITYKGETYFLPRTDAARWSRIIPVDGVRLAFCLERYPTEYPYYNNDSPGWNLTIYDADDVELPWQQVFRFIPEGPQHDAELEESPPFIDWKPYEPNRLSMVWRREFELDSPNHVEVLALPCSHPAGTTTWAWDEALREFDLTSDNRNTMINLPLQAPATRAAEDGAERTQVAGLYGTVSPWTYWAGWWSPDGIEWVLIIDGTHFVGAWVRPAAPTHTPNGPGDSYRAAADPFVPPTVPSGECAWTWNGSTLQWTNVANDCGVGKVCDPPTSPGTTDGEAADGTCRIVDCGSKKARYIWTAGLLGGWILLDHDCPTHCSPPGGPLNPGFNGEIVFVDCACTGPGCP
jgi:hypothetical protein